MDEFFDFVLPDGSKRKLTVHQARSFGCKEMNAKCDEIVAHKKKQKEKLKRRDGFIPGWQENINKYITCPVQYKRALRDLGLVEIGYDYIPQQTEDKSNVFTPEVVKHAVEMGVDLSGREIEALESGEYFKD